MRLGSGPMWSWRRRGSEAAALPLLAGALLAGCEQSGSLATRDGPAALPAPDATVAEGFTMIGTVRELADGRLLAADERENRLVVIDFATGQIMDLGRVGDGPDEYRQVGPLMPLAADSTLMVDLRARRWLLLAGDEIVETVSMSDPAVEATRGGGIVGADTMGGVVARLYPSRGIGGSTTRSDSLLVVRIDRNTGDIDTVSHASSAEQSSMAISVAGSGPPPDKPRYVMSIVPQDEVAVFADGSVAIARVEPYRVDWCPRAARCRQGPPLRATPEPTTDAEKAEYLRTAAANAGWPPTTNVEETENWPERMPPFGSFARRTYPTALIPVDDGRLLVQRMPTPEEPAMRYDVIDPDGQIARLLLPANAHIVGANTQHLYVVTTDELDVQHLSRHAWPSSVATAR